MNVQKLFSALAAAALSMGFNSQSFAAESISNNNVYIPAGTTQSYSIDVASGSKSVTASITWTSKSTVADVILYLKQGSAANSSNYDCRVVVAYKGVCSIQNPEAGIWYVGVQAYVTLNYGIEAFSTSGNTDGKTGS